MGFSEGELKVLPLFFSHFFPLYPPFSPSISLFFPFSTPYPLSIPLLYTLLFPKSNHPQDPPQPTHLRCTQTQPFGCATACCKLSKTSSIKAFELSQNFGNCASLCAFYLIFSSFSFYIGCFVLRMVMRIFFPHKNNF